MVGILRPDDAGYHHGVRDGTEPGEWKAKVMDVDDPDKMGRIRVYIAALMGGRSSDSNLWSDWIRPKMPVNTCAVPDVGALVWVGFEQGHPDRPVYSGEFFTSARPPTPRAVGDDDSTGRAEETMAGVTIPATEGGDAEYPKNRVFKSAHGIVIELDETGASEGNGCRVRIRNSPATEQFAELEFQRNGNVVLRSSNAVYVRGSSVALVGGSIAVAGSSEVLLGNPSAATHPVPKGDDLKTQLDALLAALAAFAATATTAGIEPVLAAAGTTLQSALGTVTFAGVNSTKTKTE